MELYNLPRPTAEPKEQISLGVNGCAQLCAPTYREVIECLDTAL